MVKWVKIGDITSILRGKRLTKKELSDEFQFPVYHGGYQPIGKYHKNNREANTVMVINVGASAGTVGFCREKFWSSDGCFCLANTDKFIDKFLYYTLVGLQKNIVSQVRHAGIPTLDQSAIENLTIPLPPLSDQQKIVSTLDKFEAMVENVEKELNLRQKQYEYFRESIFNGLNSHCICEQLSLIFDTRNGYTPSTNNSMFWNEGSIPWFRMEDIRENGRVLNDSTKHITKHAIKGKGLFKANSIILATSATIGEHALITVEHLSNQRFTNLYPKKEYEEKINMKYIYYYMYEVDKWCENHVNQGGFASVDMDALYKLLIPIPHLQTQQQIVSKLDHFESLIANLKQELELRKKQYEYYREKLLTFN